MKRRTFLKITLAGGASLMLPASLISSSELALPVNEMESLFMDPPMKYRSAPLWVWNDWVTKEKIARQLPQFKKQGIGGVFVHPRPGLITPYILERWYELFEYTVEQGKKLNMKIWIYDENSYPTGFAGGHVPAEMPESVNQGQGLTFHQSRTVPDRVDKFYFILKETKDGFIDVTDDIEQLRHENPANYYIFEKSYYEESGWYGGFQYVDLLLGGVTEKFIDVTMPGYEQRFGEEFGEVVPGIFSDEPNIRPPIGDNTIRWTPGLFEKFRQRKGFGLKENLPSLFEKVGNWQKVRHDYYSLLLDSFIERWSKPYANYVGQQDLIWTGHYWEHGWPIPSHGIDNMAMYAWHQMPGIDILFNNYEEGVHAQFGNSRAVKEVSSIANQMGTNRTLSETYGGGGWNLTFQDMKRIGDWEFVLGVNFLNQHLSYMTIKGRRKRDYPQSFSYHEPWWENYHVLGDYFGRLSLALSEGEQMNQTLVIEPTTSTWMYYSPTNENEAFEQIGEKFQNFVVALEAAQIEYDLGSEQVMREQGSVSNTALVVGERSYDLVVLPPGIKNLEKNTVALIEAYLYNGGEILSYVNPPDYIGGELSDKMQILKSTFENQWHQTKISEIRRNELLSSENFEIKRDDVDSGNLFHRRMQLEDGQFLFLVNTSTDEYVSGEVIMKGQSVKHMNLVSGEITPYTWDVIEGNVNFSFKLPPVGSLLLYIGDEPIKSKNKINNGTNFDTKVLPAKDSLNIQPLEPNVLALDYCNLTVKGEKIGEKYYYEAENIIFKKHGFASGNPWDEVQFKRNFLEKNDFGAKSGFKATFAFLANNLSARAKKTLQLVVERPTRWGVSINGKAVAPLSDQWWLDRAFGKYNIGKYIRDGMNKITINASPMTVFSELAPIYILGDFALESYSQGWRIVPGQSLDLGAWNKQGMPFYSRGVTYSKNYQLNSEEGAQYLVRLNEWKGTVAEVQVNGKEAGIIGWPPYELNITNMIQNGVNEITVKVIGSLKNLLGPHHNNPARWLATPPMFAQAPEQQPPGLEYDVIGYGLMQDFDLIKKF